MDQWNRERVTEDRWRKALAQEQDWREQADAAISKRLGWVEKMVWLAIGGLGVISIVVSSRILHLIP